MKRLDYYVQHLVRHNATAIELISEQPVLFRTADAERRSNAPIDHAQVLQLVKEATPQDVLQQLRKGKASFKYQSDGGAEVLVTIEVLQKSKWKVVIGRNAAAVPNIENFPQENPNLAAEDRPIGSEEVAAKKRAASVPPPPAPAAPQIRTSSGEPGINRYLRMLVAASGSDLHLSSNVTPLVRASGEIQELEARAPFNPQELFELLMEIAPERNREEFEETNDTDFAHTIEGLSRFRANYFRDRHGIGAVFRTIPFEILPVEKLGLPERVLDLCWLTKGLVLVTGPTGSGKSTTLATLIDYINSNRSDHIITIEDPIEFVHPNKKCLVNQREVGVHTRTFKAALRAALREDPDIVLVGEMRDLETISIAVETAETGHLVFGTLHTTSAISTIDRIIDQFPPEQQEQIRVMLSESIRGVIAQVLCKKIGGGRVAAYEILRSTPAASNLIREGKTFQLASVMQTGRALGMQTMNDHLVQHVQGELVTPEEAYMKSNNKLTLKETFKRNSIPLSSKMGG
ncbi:MAG: type IV pilus twitching motility protein PilT [Myxococcota bacterium]